MKYSLKFMGYREKGFGPFDQSGYYIRVVRTIDMGQGHNIDNFDNLIDDMNVWTNSNGGEVFRRNTFVFDNEENATMFVLRFS